MPGAPHPLPSPKSHRMSKQGTHFYRPSKIFQGCSLQTPTFTQKDDECPNGRYLLKTFKKMLKDVPVKRRFPHKKSTFNIVLFRTLTLWALQCTLIATFYKYTSTIVIVIFVKVYFLLLGSPRSVLSFCTYIEIWTFYYLRTRLSVDWHFTRFKKN